MLVQYLTQHPIQSTHPIFSTCVVIWSYLFCLGMYCLNTACNLDTRCLCRAHKDRNRLDLRSTGVEVTKVRRSGDCGQRVTWLFCILRQTARAMAMGAKCSLLSRVLGACLTQNTAFVQRGWSTILRLIFKCGLINLLWWFVSQILISLGKMSQLSVNFFGNL